MWPVLMSVWFNISTDLGQASVTCWPTSWVQCTLDRQKGEELKGQRPPYCGISHSSIDLGGWWRGDSGMWNKSRVCVVCLSLSRSLLCLVLSMCACLHVTLFAGGALAIFWTEGANRPLKCAWTAILRSLVSLYSAFMCYIKLWKIPHCPNWALQIASVQKMKTFHLLW